jgi:hypothetical protein
LKHDTTQGRTVEVDLRPSTAGSVHNDDGRIGRSAFLRRIVMVGGAVAASELVIFGLPRISTSAPSASQDRSIFEFALLLEELQSAFYAKVLAANILKGEQLQFAQTVGAQEKEHLAYVQNQLGGAGGKTHTFHFGDATTSPSGFLSAAVSLEEVGLGAYNGQVPNLTPGALSKAARIVPDEARHVAWIRSLAGVVPAPLASDVPLTQAEAEQHIKALNYVS